MEDFSALKSLPEGEWRVYLAGEISTIKANQVDDLQRLHGHDVEISKIHARCAGRRWQGKIVWAALAASVGALVKGLLK